MNADPRRPEKIQRYVPKTSGNGEDLTPDYMNIMGQHQTTANAAAESSVTGEQNLQVRAALEDVVQPVTDEIIAVTTNSTNVIPTSSQYGVAIIPNTCASATSDIATEAVTQPAETVTDTTAKPPLDENKDLQATPSKNDRFKVVKIASLEPFKRGRWKCMDYVDEAPPANAQNKVTPSSGSIPVTGGLYLQTQSLPQQQIQQMLLQSGFANGAQFFQNVPGQMIPQAQYFYPQVTNIQNPSMPQQVPSSMPAQFINNQPYFPAGVVPNAAGFTIPQGYSNVQFVPANLIQNQNSAFVPTSQTVQLPANFQQSQTYAGQSNVSQPNVVPPLVNGHSYAQPNEQVISNSIPTQTAKSVIINSNNSQPVGSQTQITQQNLQNHNMQNNHAPGMQNLQYQQNAAAYQQHPMPNQQTQNTNQMTSVGQSGTGTPVMQAPALIPVHQVQAQSQNFDPSLANNVYTNPQFTMSVNSLTVLESNDNATDGGNETSSVAENVSENASDDPAKTNPVVNAIDNKIEQAMDLVKSHLMYTVREEVEVLKEKIAELMERIQQLETENNFLRSQIPKAAPTTNINNAAPSSQTNNAPTASASPNVIPISNPVITSNANSQTGTPAVNNASQHPIPNAQNPSVPVNSNNAPPQ